MTIEEALKQLATVAEKLQEARKEQMEAMAVHIEEAEKRLKEAHEAREASEVKLSDLTPEEQEGCKGMWVRGKDYVGEAFEGIIFGFDEDGVLVLVPGESYRCWRFPDHLTLLPDHQRAFTSTGDPIKVDHGQWEKTHAMEEEFDRIKAEEDSATRVVAYGGLAVREVMEAASEAGTPVVEAQFTGNGGVTLFFAKKDGGDD